jgi:hypothetical protein
MSSLAGVANNITGSIGKAAARVRVKNERWSKGTGRISRTTAKLAPRSAREEGSLADRPGDFSLLSLHLLPYLGFRLLNGLAPQFLDQLTPVLFADGLELLLLLLIQQRHDLRIDFVGDLLHLF